MVSGCAWFHVVKRGLVPRPADHQRRSDAPACATHALYQCYSGGITSAHGQLGRPADNARTTWPICYTRRAARHTTGAAIKKRQAPDGRNVRPNGRAFRPMGVKGTGRTTRHTAKPCAQPCNRTVAMCYTTRMTLGCETQGHRHATAAVKPGSPCTWWLGAAREPRTPHANDDLAKGTIRPVQLGCGQGHASAVM